MSTYEKLCENVREYYMSRETNSTNTQKDIEFEWCEDNHEINLWTYWQGRKRKDVKIMVVGQDWGCPSDKLNAAAIANVKRMNSGEDCNYMDKNGSPTDNHLADLFESAFGRDIRNNKYNDLFFTNLILGYRKSKNSGGSICKCLNENDKETFRNLVKLLEPQLIICLGKETFKGVMSIYGIKQSFKGGYNLFIDNEIKNPVSLDNGSKVFAVAHCGTLGTLNRVPNRNEKSVKNGMECQRQDWIKIASFFEEVG